MDWMSRDKATLWHPYTSNPMPGPRRILERAEGPYVYEQGGHRLMDLTSSWWCNLHGHCHPRLVEALSKQSARLDQVLFSPHGHPVAIELAEALLARLGRPFQRIFYSDDGSTAVEAGLKMAVQYWHNQGRRGKNRFLAFEGGYHGDTMGAVSVSHVDQFHHFFEGMLWPTSRIPLPYGFGAGVAQADREAHCLARARERVEAEADSLAALVVEPRVLGAGGMVMYSATFLDSLVALAHQHGLLVIFDEVFTGFGRTGTFFAMDSLTHRPDIVCLSKGLTNGMLALGVTAATEAVYDAFEGGPEKTFYNGHTFTANALACSVALESLRIFDSEPVMERVLGLADVFREASPRFEALAQVGEVRQLGGIWVLDTVVPHTRKRYRPANGPGWRVASRLWDKGYWIRPLNHLLYMVPPYCLSPDLLREAIDVLYTELSGWDVSGFEVDPAEDHSGGFEVDHG